MAALSSKRYPSVCIVFLTVASSSTASPGKRSILTVSSSQLHARVQCVSEISYVQERPVGGMRVEMLLPVSQLLNIPNEISKNITVMQKSWWPCRPRSRIATARLLGPLVLIQLRIWVSVSDICFVLRTEWPP